MTFSSEQYSSNLSTPTMILQEFVLPNQSTVKMDLEKTNRNSDSSGLGSVDIRKTVAQIKDEGLGRSEKADWISVKASVSFIKTDRFCYEACPLLVGDRQCNKKVINNGDGRWQCERCDQSFPQRDYRYLLQLKIQDHTGLTWVTAFQESGEDIMGMSAKELYLLKYEEQDDAQFGEIVRRVLFSQFLFKLKVKEEAFNDEQHVKITVIKADKVNFTQESVYLLSLIDKSPMEESVELAGKGSVAASNSGMTNAGYGSIGTRKSQQHMGLQPMGGSYSNKLISSSSKRKKGLFRTPRDS
ncbi:hypothetical protein H6P81_001017 [Aristolochia fimbriata]|uniref:Replication factor A C-terminal domain-containing protein n=1 Tax=Aristolochia fimbriata TaxID=158543 RepID=A0AAV7F6F4_ARIFI|nr:hypothetical protein H6P81_001017 [Aristolochia fimbriata]